MPPFSVVLIEGIEVKVSPEPTVCQLEIDSGPCRASIIRYGYDAEKGQCIQFIYGGCQGNANNFESMAECEAKCGMGTPGR